MSKLFTQVQVFKYTVLKEINLSNLNLPVFRNHPRLRVFCNKGTTCVTCGKVGTRLILGEGRGRNHWDIYTDDLYPITIDHIQPKSLGGTNELNNLQPMCSGCNKAKGNGFPKPKRTRKCNRANANRSTSPNSTPKCEISGFINCSESKDSNINLVGKTVWKRAGKSRLLKELGVVSSVEPNPHTGRMSAVIRDKKVSFYHLVTLFVPEVS